MLIEVKNLTFSYSKEPIIKNVSLGIKKGEIVGIIGRTGSGKSTFIGHLNGLLKPSFGKVLFEGKDIWLNKESVALIKFKVGMVFQYPEHQLFEETISKDIAFGPKNMKLSSEEIEKRVIMSSNFVGLSREILKESPFEVSGGEKRKATVAGVIAMDPDVLILDEFTAGLDPISKDNLIGDILNYHKKRNNTIIFTSHDMDEVAKIADRVLVFNAGEVVMFDKTRNIFSRKEELEKLGLFVPQITDIVYSLKKMGHKNLPECALSVKEAVEAIYGAFGNKV